MMRSGKRFAVLLSGVILVAVFAFGVVGSPSALAASEFVVNSTLDTGDNTPGDNICDDGAGNCTLRAAIQEANANANPNEQDVIRFGLTGPEDFPNDGEHGYTFSPASPYDAITQSVLINGYTQTGAAANDASYPDALNGRLLIRIDGTQVANTLLAISSDNVAVKGLIIGGVNAPGHAAISAGLGTNILIGGNYIGTDPTGMTADPNYIGILVFTDGVAVGSSSPGDRNLVSGNTVGIDVLSANNTVKANIIGPNAAGDATTGLSASQTPLVLLDANAHDNLIGSAGGPGNTEGNVIAGNATGVVAYGSVANGYPVANAFVGNSVYGNVQNGGIVGFDLATDADGDFQPESDLGSNANDAGDGDTGANDFINTPTLDSAVYNVAAGRLFVTFGLDAAGSPGGNYHVEFFANDTSGTGQGKTLIYATDSVNNGSPQGYDFVPYNSYDPTGKYITATVTQNDPIFDNSYGSTSEFSAPLQVSAGEYNLDVSKQLTNASEIHVGGHAIYDVTITNNGDIPVAFANNSDSYGIYDVYSSNLTFDSVSGDDAPVCQTFSDQDAQQFLGQGAMNHTDSHLMYCIPSETSNRVLFPGESSTMTMSFTVNSIPSNGFLNLAMLFSQYDPDFVALAQAVQDGGVDIIDLFETGSLQGNPNIALARYTPGQGTLAASGSSPVPYTLIGFVIMTPALVVARRRNLTFRISR